VSIVPSGTSEPSPSGATVTCARSSIVAVVLGVTNTGAVVVVVDGVTITGIVVVVVVVVGVTITGDVVVVVEVVVGVTITGNVVVVVVVVGVANDDERCAKAVAGTVHAPAATSTTKCRRRITLSG
jgi:hypothetical protein